MLLLYKKQKHIHDYMLKIALLKILGNLMALWKSQNISYKLLQFEGFLETTLNRMPHRIGHGLLSDQSLLLRKKRFG
jgi:hypothetical protein